MKAELLSVMGDDLMVANVARTSYSKWKSEFDESDEKLIRYLHKHNHVSPFYHPKIQFRIECPIFVERQLLKHLIGFIPSDDVSQNSVSGRYVDFSEEFWEPTELREQSKDSKQGSSGIMNRPDLLKKMEDSMYEAGILYRELVEEGVAKELARIILPLSLMTKFIWTGSLYAFLHLFKLRLKEDAQKETRLLVQSIFNQIADTGRFPVTISTFFPSYKLENDNNG